MVEVNWSASAYAEFESIAQLIGFENPAAAKRFVARVLAATRQLERFPNSGSRIRELPREPFRQLVVRPCRIFYRVNEDEVRIHLIMRHERLFKKEYLDL